MPFGLKLFTIFSFNKMDWFKISRLCCPPWKRYTNPCWQVPQGWLGQKHWQSTLSRQMSQQRLNRDDADKPFAYFRPQLVFIIWMARMLRETGWSKPYQTVCEESRDLRWGGSGAPLWLNPSLPLWDPPVNWDGALISLYKGLSTLFNTMQISSKMETAETFCCLSVLCLRVTVTHIPSQSFLDTN